MDKVKGVIGIILIYAVLNLILWGCQELYWMKDTQEIKRIESSLESEKSQISLLEAKISDQSNSIDIKQKELARLESSNLIDDFNAGVDEYNSLLQEYKSNVDAYNSKLDKYNEQVDRSNELIKKSGSRWYLIPIPMPGKSARPKL